MNSLKRQASKARRYRELHEELRGRLKTVLISRLKALEVEFQRLRAELAQVQETCLAAAQELEALEHEQKGATQRYEELEDQLTQCRERLSQGDLERERLLSRLEQVKQQTGNLEARSGGSRARKLRTPGAACHSRAADGRAHPASGEIAAGICRGKGHAGPGGHAPGGSELPARRRRTGSGNLPPIPAWRSSAMRRSCAISLCKRRRRAWRSSARRRAPMRRSPALRRSIPALAAELEAYLSEHQRDASTLAELAESVSQTTRDLEQARSEEVSLRSQVGSPAPRVFRQHGPQGSAGAVPGAPRVQHGECAASAFRRDPDEWARVPTAWGCWPILWRSRRVTKKWWRNS